MKLNKTIFFTLALCCTFEVGSFEIAPFWSDDFVPHVKLTCQNDEEFAYCNQLCGDESECLIEEGFCRDCAGANLALREIFLEVGDLFVRSIYPVSFGAFAKFLKQGDFVTLTSKSIYNFVDYYDSEAVQAQFQQLCNEKDEYPVLFLKVDHYSRLIEKIEYVVCRNLYDDRALVFNLEKPRPFVPLSVKYIIK